MPRQLIKPRGFQEPIHEDAPGFDDTLGHKNLITELNEEVLPSWITDVVGPVDADPSEYQIRRNAQGLYEVYDHGSSSWTVLAGAGGGGDGGDAYEPAYSATVEVESPIQADAFVRFDLETDKAWGPDFRMYQYGLRRRADVWRVAFDPVTGKTTYRVLVEANLALGPNQLEIRYGDPQARFAAAPQWSLADDFDFMVRPSEGDAWAVLAYRNFPEWFPRPTDWDDFYSLFAPHYSGSYYYPGMYSYLDYGDVQLFDAVNQEWKSARWNTGGLGFYNSPNFYGVDSTSHPNGTLAFALSNSTITGSNYYPVTLYVGRHDTPNGAFFGHKVAQSNSSTYHTNEYSGVAVVGALNNGWLVHYMAHNTGSVRSTSYPRTRYSAWIGSKGHRTLLYHTPDHELADWSSALTAYALVPIVPGTVALLDTPL